MNRDRLDVLIVGESYRVAMLRHALQKRGVKASGVIYDSPSDDLELWVGIGNGDTKERAQQTFEKPLFESYWGLSELNYQLAQKWLEELAVPFRRETVTRFDREEKTELSLVFSRRELANRLSPPPAAFSWAGSQPRFSADGEYRYQYFPQGDQKLDATIVIFVSEFVPLKLFPELQSVMIPITLSHFYFPSGPLAKSFGGLFNGGADYAIKLNSAEVRIGSYRNLFQDRGVGFRTEPDELTRQNLVKFFGERGWLDGETSQKWGNSWETLSCDGIPLVGTLPKHSGVYLTGGFGGHTDNFFFAVVEALAEGISGQGDFARLASFSLAG